MATSSSSSRPRSLAGPRPKELAPVLRAMGRIDELISEGRKQARHASGGHATTSLFSAFTIGILAGAVVGAAIALLITPLSGMQARAKLAERVDKLRSDDSDKVNWDEAPSPSG